MGAKRAKRSGRKGGQAPQRPPVKEVLYDRVTGRSQDVVILPPPPPPSTMTLRLRTDQRAKLDRASQKIARTTGERMSVAAIIRGALDALLSVDLDLAECRNEADVKAAILARLARRR